MAISIEDIKQLREKTNAGVMECKKALKEADGDMGKALEILKIKGSHIAAKKSGREAKEGCIGCYIHSDSKLGVLVELNCETDFVGKNPEFKQFAKEIAMQVAACTPEYMSQEEVPEDVKNRQIENIKSEIDLTNKPGNVVNKIIEGKLGKFYQQICLLNQPFIKNDEINIKEHLNSTISKFGENIKISRFVKFKVGE